MTLADEKMKASFRVQQAHVKEIKKERQKTHKIKQTITFIIMMDICSSFQTNSLALFAPSPQSPPPLHSAYQGSCGKWAMIVFSGLHGQVTSFWSGSKGWPTECRQGR
jgi:hypothetical protein